ncbi:helicase-associated domain-containing protein [Streptomyces sp. bgisy100]|uniref:helicase-associated domain-containing protein n=1 Tax=Streptomyces sp. bgisy100 TaxID=3413783 RepID=UPI003D72F4EF
MADKRNREERVPTDPRRRSTGAATGSSTRTGTPATGTPDSTEAPGTAPGTGTGTGTGTPSATSTPAAPGTPDTTTPRTPRTLAEELRTRPDPALATLLRARPDLLSPVPGDLTQLATRAGTRASVVRALERLDRFALQTAEALAIAPDPCPYPALLGLMAGDSGDEVIERELPRALSTLRAQALVWGGEERLRLVRTAREVLAGGTALASSGTAAPTLPGRTSPTGAGRPPTGAGRPYAGAGRTSAGAARPPAGPARTSPTGLGPTVAEAATGMSPGRLQEIIATAGLPATHDPVTAVDALTALFEDRTRMAALLAEAPEESRETLARLVWGPPYGTVPANPSPQVRWLTARGLLLPTGSGTVALPREVALHLRDGRAHRTPEPLPPALEPVAEHRPGVVDATAAGQAFAALGVVEDLLKEWELGGPGVLRAGGMSVRDLKRTATALDTDEPTAAFWLELAFAAGLLASDGEADERFAATPAYDEWQRRPAEQRWSALAAAWLTATRTAGLVGGQDAKGRTLSALGPGLDRSPAPHFRRRTLELLATLPDGGAPQPDAVLARLRWEHGAPARPSEAPGQGAGPGPAGHPYPYPHPHPHPDDLRSRIARWTLAEAERLGVTGRGALSTHGRALLGTPTAPGEPAPEASVLGEPAPGRLAPGHPAPGSPAPEPTATGAPATAAPAAASPTTIVTGTLPAPGADGTAATAPTPGDSDGRIPPQPTTASTPDTGPTTRDNGTGPGAPPATETHPAEVHAAAAIAAALLAPKLPEPLDHVLLQADLTAVAPGPLERPLAEMLGVLADVESKGGATVYRFTPGSVRRALDAGQTASDLHAFLAEHSRTPVPQPLSYLIDDVARKHGHLRVGAASAYIRCDDDALLAEILADRRSSGLRLRRLAPTVLATQAPPDQLLECLRDMGYAPAAESAEGDVVITRADAHRTPPRTAPAPVQGGPPVPDATLLTAAVKAIRAGDLAATAVRRPAAAQAPEAREGAPSDGGRLPRTTSAETLATVQAAALTSSAVWIGYVNADGAASQRVIAPVRVEGGFVTAYDHTADEIRTYPLHRITGVAELADDPT